MSTLLIIMNPRLIPDCIEALDALDVDKVWATCFTETELESVIPGIIESTNYSRYSIISDDTIPTQAAFDTVLDIHNDHPNSVACGWVNIDSVSNLSTYHPQQLAGSMPSIDAYRFETIDTARRMNGIQRTYFHAMVFATMNKELWQRYPFKSFQGHASDLHQCVRLQRDNIPIFTSRECYVHHVKEVRDRLDTAPEKRLLLGERASGVYFDQPVKK